MTVPKKEKQKKVEHKKMANSTGIASQKPWTYSPLPNAPEIVI